MVDFAVTPAGNWRLGFASRFVLPSPRRARHLRRSCETRVCPPFLFFFYFASRAQARRNDSVYRPVKSVYRPRPLTSRRNRFDFLRVTDISRTVRALLLTDSEIHGARRFLVPFGSNFSLIAVSFTRGRQAEGDSRLHAHVFRVLVHVTHYSFLQVHARANEAY